MNNIETYLKMSVDIFFNTTADGEEYIDKHLGLPQAFCEPFVFCHTYLRTTRNRWICYDSQGCLFVERTGWHTAPISEKKAIYFRCLTSDKQQHQIHHPMRV